MTQKRAEEIADEIVNDFSSTAMTYREATVKHLLGLFEKSEYDFLSQALNEGDGAYRP